MMEPSSNAGASILTNSIQWDSSWPEWLEKPERDRLLGFFQERFGIPQTVFTNHHFCRRGATVWMLNKDHRLPSLASLRVQSVGLPLLRRIKAHLKPTSVALQLFGRHASKNIVSLEPEQLGDLAERKEIKGEFTCSPGYVIVVTNSVIVGCALCLPGRLISQFPRHMFTDQTWNDLLQNKEKEKGLPR
jgi:NOL1/NOP2/fmu family ribosome biogenesis protein